MTAKKKRKQKRKNNPRRDYLTYQLYSPFAEEKTFPWGKVILFLFIGFELLYLLLDYGKIYLWL